LVANVYPPEELVDKAVAKAEKIAANSILINQMAKEAVNNGEQH